MAEKLDMKSMDITQENISKIQALFPSAVTEVMGEDGKVKLAIDFDVLKQELSADLISEKQERYQMTWPDKSKAKVLANSRITATLRPDKEKSVDFDNTQNLYIEGDNLDVLKLLRETYLGKVKMIYIDPPYNTGNDFVYEDDFAMSAEDYSEISGQYDEQGNRLVVNSESNGRFHTDWLNMIYPRLKVARDLLVDDGVIFVSIDDNEVENLKKICDEIFGENNFIGIWNWYKSATPPNLSKKTKKNIEYILCYEKSKNSIRYRGIQKSSPSSNGLLNQTNKMATLIFPANTVETGLKNGIYKSGEYGTSSYQITLLEDAEVKDGIFITPIKLQGKFKWGQENLLNEIKNGTKIAIRTETFSPSYEKAEYEPEVPPNLIDKTVNVDTTEQAGKILQNLFGGVKLFDYPKPVDLLMYLCKFIDTKNDIIVDFFSGSATTAHAVMQLNAEDGGNRKFIMVQLPEKCDEKSEAYKAGYKTICDIGEERIRRAGKKIKEEGGLTTQDLDIGFRVLKLDSSNMQEVYYNPSAMTQSLLDSTVDNVKSDRTPLDLLFQVMFDLGIELSAKIDEHTVNGKTYYAVNGNDIIACFDDNIDNDVITAIAKQFPLYAVFKDKSFATDSVGINNEQLFKTYSPSTVVKVI